MTLSEHHIKNCTAKVPRYQQLPSRHTITKLLKVGQWTEKSFRLTPVWTTLWLPNEVRRKPAQALLAQSWAGLSATLTQILTKQNKRLLFKVAPQGNEWSPNSHTWLPSFYYRICWHLAEVRITFRILNPCSFAKDRLQISIGYTYSVKEYFNVTSRVFRRNAITEISYSISFNTFSRVPYATSSQGSERSHLSSQFWGRLHAWVAEHHNTLVLQKWIQNTFAKSKWTSFKMIPCKPFGAIKGKDHNINSEMCTSPIVLKQKSSICPPSISIWEGYCCMTHSKIQQGLTTRCYWKVWDVVLNYIMWLFTYEV